MIHPLTEQFYWRLGTIHFASWHVQIINKHNLQSQEKQITQGTSCDHDREGNKVLSVRAHLKSLQFTLGVTKLLRNLRTSNPCVSGLTLGCDHVIFLSLYVSCGQELFFTFTSQNWLKKAPYRRTDKTVTYGVTIEWSLFGSNFKW